MKDVDPNGCRTATKMEAGDHSGALRWCGLHLQDPIAPPTSSQHSSRVMAHPLTGDHSTDAHLEMEAHPVPPSLDCSTDTSVER